MADDDMMVMAGLWDEWQSPQGERIRSCMVITTDANDAIGALHDRMPVILDEEDWPKWLGEEPAGETELKALLVPCRSSSIKLWPVDKRVGNVRNKRPSDLALEIPASEQVGPDPSSGLHKAEIETRWPITRAANIKLRQAARPRRLRNPRPVSARSTSLTRQSAGARGRSAA